MIQKSMTATVRKLDKLQKDIKSTCFGDWVYKNIPILEAIEMYAQYREELAIAVIQGSGVPYVRTFEEWLDKEPLEETITDEENDRLLEEMDKENEARREYITNGGYAENL